jgi:hypothetical protein
MPLAMSDFLEPGGGPEQTGDFTVDPTFFLVMFGIGFAIGMLGHLFKSRVLVAVGVLLIMLATVLVPVALQATR